MAEPIYNTSGNSIQRDALDDLVNAFELNRGITCILSMKWPDVVTNGIPDVPAIIEDEEGLEKGLDEHYPILLTVMDALSILCDDMVQLESCQKAIRRTFLYMRALEVKSEVEYSRRLIQHWPHSLNKNYIKMVITRHPAALIVLSYYAALMSMKSDTWWLYKWPALIINRVADLLEPEAEHLLDWPRQWISKYKMDLE